jgi:hypothetical protein
MHDALAQPAWHACESKLVRTHSTLITAVFIITCCDQPGSPASSCYKLDLATYSQTYSCLRLSLGSLSSST